MQKNPTHVYMQMYRKKSEKHTMITSQEELRGQRCEEKLTFFSFACNFTIYMHLYSCVIEIIFILKNYVFYNIYTYTHTQ